MSELHPENAREAARSAMGYSQAFDGMSIDWQNGEPWPHRMELAQALDWIKELGAMVLNLADRAEALDAKGTSDCPICGHDTPHGHDHQDIMLWLRKQAARFIPDAATRLHIALVGEEETKLRARIRELEKTVEDQEEVGRQIMHLDYARHSNTAANIGDKHSGRRDGLRIEPPRSGRLE